MILGFHVFAQSPSAIIQKHSKQRELTKYGYCVQLLENELKLLPKIVSAHRKFSSVYFYSHKW